MFTVIMDPIDCAYGGRNSFHIPHAGSWALVSPHISPYPERLGNVIILAVNTVALDGRV